MWLWILIGVVIIALAFLAYKIFLAPESNFKSAEIIETPEPTHSVLAPAFDLDPEASPDMIEESSEDDSDAEPTSEPDGLFPPESNQVGELEEAKAALTPIPSENAAQDQQPMDNIVNIMLMGIDAFEDGGTTSGVQPHTDAMMVIAVNFDKNVVDVISLPRDIFTDLPGIRGYYKLNCAFNAGGGMEDMKSGFELTCKAAEQWLGGVTIPYYYALDFQAVVDIVDAIGGIDYNVDQEFHAANPENKNMDNGEFYKRGYQHLDGNAVLGYIRIRKQADGLDSSRTKRQRKMMVAIFNKLKKEGKLSQVPALINAASSGIYTNTNIVLTTSLANYALNNISSEQIRTRSMYGTIASKYDYKYCFVDQQNRIKLIKEVYGIKAEPIGVNSARYESWLHEIGFYSMKYEKQAEKVLTRIQQQKDSGKEFSKKQISSYTACYNAYTALIKDFEKYSKKLQEAFVGNKMSRADVFKLEDESIRVLKRRNEKVKTTTIQLVEDCNLKVGLNWKVKAKWYTDRDINEKNVVFN